MNRKISRGALGLAVLLGCASPARAQFTGSNQTLPINHATNNWTGAFYIGSNAFNDVVLITNAGRLNDGLCYLGFNAGDNINAALVAGAGSVWSNGDALVVGNAGSGNKLTVATGGNLFNVNGTIGNLAGANNNAVVITDPGSVWNQGYDLYVGFNGSGNLLLITNGGAVYDNQGYIGVTSNAGHNTVIVTGPGSVWSNRSDVYLGDTAGFGGTLTIANGGRVYNALGIVGFVSGASNNSALVTGAGSVWSNSSTLYIGEFSTGNSLTIANGGTVAAFAVTVGLSVNNINNTLAIHGGSLVTTAGANGVLDVVQGAVTMDSGTIQAQGVWLLNGLTGTLHLTGGSLMANTLTNSGGANLVFSGCTLQPFSSDANWPAALVLSGGVTLNTLDAAAQARSVNLSGPISGGATLNVAGTGTLLVNGTVTGGGLITALPGARLGGTGSVAAVQILANATLGTVTNLGTFSAANLTLSGGAHLQEGLNATSGVAGVDWDLLNIAGPVNLSGISSSLPVTVDVINRGGLAVNNPQTSALSWTMLTAAGGITGYVPNGFVVTTTGLGGWSFGQWSVALVGNSLQLRYAPPSPASVVGLASPPNGGSVTGGGIYLAGSNITLTAVANPSWQFMGWSDGVTNNPRVIAVPAAGGTYTANFGTTVGLGAALEALNLIWSIGGVAAWYVETGTQHGTASAAQSGALGAGQISYLQATTNGPGSLQFWWKVSSDPANELQFYINTQLVSQISGNVDWNQYAAFLGTSNQVTFTWVYAKNSSAVAGSDAGWVDQVNWMPCPYAEHVPQLFFQYPGGMLASWVVNGTGGFQFARVLANTGGWALKAAGDVDGDGVSDLLFQNTVGDTGGWFMNPDGSVRDARFWFNVGAWEIRACGDFEGLGNGQLFFQTAAGVAAYWRVDTNGNFLSSEPLGSMGVWKLRGAGDLDGDHKAELFWQNPAGQVAIWYHSPSNTVYGAIMFSTGIWALCGVTDIDNDGVSDLLWQTAAGDVAGWFMNSNSTVRAASAWGNSGAWKLKAAGR